MSEPVRYIVESIEPQNETFLRDLEVGNTIEVPDGFPSECDHPDPGEPVVILREMQPNVAWFLGEAVDEGTVVLRRVTPKAGVPRERRGRDSPRSARRQGAHGRRGGLLPGTRDAQASHDPVQHGGLHLAPVDPNQGPQPRTCVQGRRSHLQVVPHPLAGIRALPIRLPGKRRQVS